MRKIYWGVCFLFSITTSYAQQKWDSLPKLPDHYKARIAEFEKMQPVRNATLFLGNGQIERGKWKALLGDSAVLNYGIEGDITYGVLARLKGVIARKPSKVYILVGTDDFSKQIPDENIISNIFSIAHRLKRALPSAQIIVFGMMPVNSSFKNFPRGYDHNDLIHTVNEQVHRYAEKLGYKFVDLYGGFSDQKGHLDVKYSSDGVHLNPAGYARWAELLKDSK